MIVGKIPPPIGGVTIHVQRLLQSIRNDKIDHKFISLTKSNLLKITSKLFAYKIVFLHTSNSFIRLFFVIISRLSGTRLLFTFHGNLGRFSGFRNMIDELSIRLATVPIMINKKSFERGKELNSRSQFIPAFIPPITIQDLPAALGMEVKDFVDLDDKILCCTNAYNISFDVDGEEIYCGSKLVKLFNELPSHKLIFSDPSGNYKKYLLEQGIEIPNNVLMITEPHDFIQIIKLSKIFIRATLTDGDSLSVKEGLFFKRIVICSDCVDRPKGVVLYENNNYDDLKDKIENISTFKNEKSEILNGYDLLKKLIET